MGLYLHIQYSGEGRSDQDAFSVKCEGELKVSTVHLFPQLVRVHYFRDLHEAQIITLTVHDTSKKKISIAGNCLRFMEFK